MSRSLLAITLLLGLGLASSAEAQWALESADGKSSIKLGFLAQLRADSEELANGEDAQNLYFRRLRILFGGKLSEKWTFFFETDSPNLGKSDASGAKNTGDVFIQDFFVTYEQSTAFKLDMGLILIPLTRNSQQSAATLLASDYGPYSFLASGPTQSRVGRDYGIQARGALAEDRFEYRIGVYDGARGENAADDLRYAGRIAFSAIGTETGMFYTGNNLGAKRQLTFGLGFDHQDDYDALGADVFFDQPIGDSGAAFTIQGDFIAYDGGTTFASLPEQDTTLLEVGFLLPGGKWQPWLQWASRDFAEAARVDEEQLWVGVNYRIAKHNRVARLALGRIEPDGGSSREVVQLTLQAFTF